MRFASVQTNKIAGVCIPARVHIHERVCMWEECIYRWFVYVADGYLGGVCYKPVYISPLRNLLQRAVV